MWLHSGYLMSKMCDENSAKRWGGHKNGRRDIKINRLTFFVSVYSVITSEVQSLSRK